MEGTGGLKVVGGLEGEVEMVELREDAQNQVGWCEGSKQLPVR